MSQPETTSTEVRTHRKRRWPVVLAAVVVLALLAGAGALVLYARGGGPVPDSLAFLRPKGVDLLAASGPAETSLRTLRLAGYDRAAVGEASGTVVVRVEMPRATSTDVELSWQTALAAGATAYPRANRVVAQLFSAGVPILEVSAPAGAVQEAVARNDGAALRKSASFRYLSSAGGGESGG